jgi:ABC-type transporter Mla maintaining outer membrane lipid asymmetry ATPase subunit MlaF
MPIPVLELKDVRKSYGGLRPLRLNELQVLEGQSVAVLNVEAPAVDVFVNLVTGAGLPDEGEVRIFGSASSAIESGEAWLASLERFGIVSERVVLLEEMSVAQNLAIPYTLELDPIPAAVQESLTQLAAEVALDERVLHGVAGRATPEARIRLRLARALALEPALLLLEHPTVGLTSEHALAFAADLGRIAEARHLSVLIVTADRAFADAAAHDVYTLQPATGALARARGKRARPATRERGWRRWFSR